MSMPRDHVPLFMRHIRECGYTVPRSVSWMEIARRLNAAGHRTYYGNPWTDRTLRAFVTYHADPAPESSGDSEPSSGDQPESP